MPGRRQVRRASVGEGRAAIATRPHQRPHGLVGTAEPAAAQKNLRNLLRRPLPKAFNGPPPVATDAAFVELDGKRFFRTGDLGRMDADGYISITGRLKEIINRGGEKVSPREVDEILMDHPAVGQVVCFAMPHPKLGEEVAAAVVLREGCDPWEEWVSRPRREYPDGVGP